MQQQQSNEAVTHLEKALKGNLKDPDILNSLGVALAAVEEFDEAIEHHQQAIEIKPRDPNYHYNLAAAFKQQGKAAAALKHYQQAYELAPQRPIMANALAWMLATSEDENLRQNPKAVELATQACQATENAMPEMLDTLAAAYAAAGDFEKAATTGGRAATLARSLGNAKLAREIQERLRLYRDEKPYVEERLP